ncbi:MAG: hypothetical protein GY757_57385 [bacterium]|nr:hypothetical protein [bacterium]
MATYLICDAAGLKLSSIPAAARGKSAAVISQNNRKITNQKTKKRN